MRLIKTLSLGGFVAVAAMSFAGASPAMASTALCNTNTDPCESPYKSLHTTLTEGHVFKLHGTSPTLNILCLEVLAAGHVGALGEPQEAEVSELNFGGCGTNSGHSNCEIEVLETPLYYHIYFLVGLFKAHIEGLFALIIIDCEVPFIGHIECEYGGEGLAYEMKSAGGENGHGMLNAAGTELENVGGAELLCPDTMEIEEGLLEPLTDVYLST